MITNKNKKDRKKSDKKGKMIDPKKNWDSRDDREREDSGVKVITK